MNPKNLNLMAIVFAILLTFAPAAMAQESNAPTLSSMTLQQINEGIASANAEIGNNNSGGTTRVSVGSVTQTQSGVFGSNNVRIGNR